MNKLKFFGTGGAFDTNVPNSSAYLTAGKNNDILFIIDCGETVIPKILDYLKENQRIKNIVVAISHTHSDHAGGLPTLCHYVKYIMTQTNLTILCKNQEFSSYLSMSGVEFNSRIEFKRMPDIFTIGNVLVIPVATEHVGHMWCLGFLISIRDNIETTCYQLDIGNPITNIYFSGDSCDIPPVFNIDEDQHGSPIIPGIRVNNNQIKGEVFIPMSNIDYWYQDLYLIDIPESLIETFPHMTPSKFLNKFKWNDFRGKLFFYHNADAKVEGSGMNLNEAEEYLNSLRRKTSPPKKPISEFEQ